MHHAFMEAVAKGLLTRGVATLRYQFPYMEAGARRVDPPAVAHATIRAAVAFAAKRLPQLPLFAGGKSFGARMTSQAEADRKLPCVQGLLFFGFPLHPAGKPATSRASHLSGVVLPMLFLQGTRDALAAPDLLEGVVGEVGQRATLATIQEADHSFHVPVRSGRTDKEVLDLALDIAAAWMTRVIETREQRQSGAK